MSGEAVGTESAPTSTHDIVANVVETAEAQDHESSAIDAAAADDVSAPVAEPVKTEPQKELSIEEQLLHEFGFKEMRRADGREHYISRSKVLQMIGSGLKRGQARWDGERESISREAAELKAFRDELVNDVRGEDTKKFLERISEYNPAFRAYLQPAQTPQAPAVTEKPQADIDLGNGRWAYSVEQNEKLVEWKAQQLLDARLKPWEDQQKAEKERAQEAEAQQVLRERSQAQMAEAQTWPMFGQISPDGPLTEFQQAVLKRLEDDSAQAAAKGQRPRMTLKEAYLEERTAYLAADDNTKRARWMEEANKAQRSTAVTRNGVDASTKPGPRDPKDVVREVVARLERDSQRS